MSQPARNYQPVDLRGDLERTPEQVGHETAMIEVAETLANIEQAIRRAERARRAVAVLGRERNVEIALASAVATLQTAHKGLFQDGYFSDDQQKLI